MRLVKNLPSKKQGNRFRSFGLFYCDYCKKEVERLLFSGKKCKSCGCVRGKLGGESRTTHNDSNLRLYGIWQGIKNRCLNKRGVWYKYYRGRGITICDEWKNDYLAFKKWALENGYQDNLEIDREDNDGNYEPGNCRFVTHKINSRNRKNMALNNEKVKEMRLLKKVYKYTNTYIAKIFRVPQSTVSMVVNNKIWRD